jgi:hypothetical protein
MYEGLARNKRRIKNEDLFNYTLSKKLRSEVKEPGEVKKMMLSLNIPLQLYGNKKLEKKSENYFVKVDNFCH